MSLGRDSAALVEKLRGLALRALARMYSEEHGLFVFRVRRGAAGLDREGLSRRYTAITLIGLAGESDDAVRRVLAGRDLDGACGALLRDVAAMDNLGDVALCFWAAAALDHPDAERAAGALLRRLEAAAAGAPTVELSWALAALCLDPARRTGGPGARVAERLLASFDRRSALFPHVVGEGGGLRAHVSCFADLVYPIHALAHYARVAGGDRAAGALEAASRCAQRACALQGPAGQWWWQYDRRTGRVVERYPVYAVHQDAMAPMALLALREAGGPDLGAAVERGLAWLAAAPELDGGTLLDEAADVVWRKVARREPGKLSRYLQAGASRLHADLRVPGLDVLLPPGAVDYEDRPYHLGWLLYAWRGSGGAS